MASESEISEIRDAARRIVRELGFMRPTLAGTDLSPSSVHAMIEIGRGNGITAQTLAQALLLEKSTISRLLDRLVARGLVLETPSPKDGRSKMLALTATGQALLAEIDIFATTRVGKALDALIPAERAHAVAGLRAYASGLEATRSGGGGPAEVEIRRGLEPGAIGRIVDMHGRYYGREWQFGTFFEARVASGLAEFSARLDRPMNALWLARHQGRIVGSAAIDGEDLGEGKAHLRWVIVEDGLRGSGTGRRLLTEAINFCDRHGFAEIHLWTFKGLDAARRLYEGSGFVLAEEWTGNQWGRDVIEQRFVRRVS